MEKLNLTFKSGDVLKAATMQKINDKIDEIVDTSGGGITIVKSKEELDALNKPEGEIAVVHTPYKNTLTKINLSLIPRLDNTLYPLLTEETFLYMRENSIDAYISISDNGWQFPTIINNENVDNWVINIWNQNSLIILMLVIGPNFIIANYTDDINKMGKAIPLWIYENDTYVLNTSEINKFNKLVSGLCNIYSFIADDRSDPVGLKLTPQQFDPVANTLLKIETGELIQESTSVNIKHSNEWKLAFNMDYKGDILISNFDNLFKLLEKSIVGKKEDPLNNFSGEKFNNVLNGSIGTGSHVENGVGVDIYIKGGRVSSTQPNTWEGFNIISGNNYFYELRNNSTSIRIYYNGVTYNVTDFEFTFDNYHFPHIQCDKDVSQLVPQENEIRKFLLITSPNYTLGLNSHVEGQSFLFTVQIYFNISTIEDQKDFIVLKTLEYARNVNIKCNLFKIKDHYFHGSITKSGDDITEIKLYKNEFIHLITSGFLIISIGFDRAYGVAAHAEGNKTISNGDYTHAQNNNTFAENKSQTSLGQFNTKETTPSPTTFAVDKTLVSIGNGTSDTDRSDAMKMLGDGTTWIAGVGGFTGKNPTAENSLLAVIKNAGGGFYTLPVATVDTLGGVQPVTKTDEMTQEVGIDVTGKLFTKAGGSSGVGKVDTTPDSTYHGEIFNDYSNNMATGPYSHAEGEKTVASGEASYAGGFLSLATGRVAIAEGKNVYAVGDYSHAEGTNTQAKAIETHAEGSGSIATGWSSHAEGVNSESRGHRSHAEGHTTLALGIASHTQNFHTVASNWGQSSTGQYNTEEASPSSDSFNQTKLLVSVGNGTGDTARSDAFTIKGNGETYAAGKLLNPAADYAEMFEWEDGNPLETDRVGCLVELIGDKIKLADETSTNIIGVVSGNPAVLGDSPQFWHNKYTTDEWGRVLYEDVEVKYKDFEIDSETHERKEVTKTRVDHLMAINKDFDNTQTYVDRRDRKEWDAIGLLGKLLVKQDGTLTVGSHCKSGKNGIATKSDSGFYVMKVTSDKQALILIK